MTRSHTKITIETVKALHPSGIAWDSIIRGFCVRRRATSVTYFLKTRIRGWQLWLRIGDAGTWTPTTARREAQRLLMALPGTEEPELLRRNPRGQVTVAGLCDRYMAEHLEIRNQWCGRPVTRITLWRLSAKCSAWPSAGVCAGRAAIRVAVSSGFPRCRVRAF